MTEQEFLANQQRARNPLADEQAQSDSVFRRFCISGTFHPTWSKVVGDAKQPAKAVVAWDHLSRGDQISNVRDNGPSLQLAFIGCVSIVFGKTVMQSQFVRLLLLVCGIACCSCVPTPKLNEPLSASLDRVVNSEDQHSSEELMQKILSTLKNNLEKRELSTDRNAAWQVIHGAVAYGDQLPLSVDGKSVLAIDYLLSGGEINGWEISAGPVLSTTKRPGVLVRVEAGSYIGQGHTDQWLGYLSQIPLGLDRKVMIKDQTLTLEDWARQAQWDVPKNPFKEYSWTLIALTNFFPNEREWQASDGITWTLEPLVRFEAQQDLSESPCGGMHRLMGLAHAVRYRKRLRGLFDEGWMMAKKVVDDSIVKARQFQNSDGSFSTNYTSRPGNSSDLSSCISATGHTFEFLSYALDDLELRRPWMERAASRLCDMLRASEEIDLECGGVYHALAGLKLYHHRRFE